MSAPLNIGKGRCQGTARLLVKPVKAVIELGALQDVLTAALNCVHHANRTGGIEDFIAVAFPQMRKGREGIIAGHEVELIGSETALGRFSAMEGMAKLRRRGMIEDAEIGEVWMEPGETGAAYVRARSGEKYTEGWIRRTAARAERRGKPLGKKLRRIHSKDADSLALCYGGTVVHVREIHGVFSEAPIMVSTYGFSSPVSPAVLPVVSDSVRRLFDAA
jgi:hypothetical protein